MSQVGSQSHGVSSFSVQVASAGKFHCFDCGSLACLCLFWDEFS